MLATGPLHLAARQARAGQTFVVTTNAQGNTGPVDLTPNPPVAPGRAVTATATATDANGNTSAFSDPEPVGSPE